MKLKKLIFLLLFLTANVSFALDHIGGGELYITRIAGNNYRIQIIYYYDAFNYTDPPPRNPIPVTPSPPTTAEVGIYRKLNNLRVLNLNLPRISSTFIGLPINPCLNVSIPYRGLERIVYETTVVLSNASFSDLQGYYAIFQDYTRNTSALNNISGRLGISLYAEFPRVATGATSFINSNPVFGTLSSLYICNGQISTLNFSASDADGDNLVYSLVDMYDALPIIRNPPPPSLPLPLPLLYPYPPPAIAWNAGFSATNAIPSNVALPLSISSSTGLLTVNPAQKGVYGFAVKCEEFRAGIKIGEVRRDFQLFVNACQSVFSNPIIRLPLPTNSSVYYQPADVLEIDANTFPEGQILLNPESLIQPDIYQQTSVSFSVTANNFSNTSTNRIIITPREVKPDIVTGFARTFLQLPECWENNKIYDFNIIVSDQKCPTEGKASLNVRIRFKARSSNLPPRLSISNSFPQNIQNNSLVVVAPKDSINLSFLAFSNQPRSKDTLEIVAVPVNFILEDFGMRFTGGSKAVINTRATFFWKPDCQLIKANGQSDTLLVRFYGKRTPSTRCFVGYDTISVKFLLKDTYAHFEEFLPPNAFTPNGDGVNDIFTLSNLQPLPPASPDGIKNPNLPLDNCLAVFRHIKIYNRWGKEIFGSTDRNFSWSGDNFPSGLYYYKIQFSNKIYKGTITLMK